MATKGSTTWVAVLALGLAAMACSHKEEPAARTSTTQTTSSDDFIERTRIIDDMFVHPEDNPAGWGTDAAVLDDTKREARPDAGAE
jgi:hypothetical protein